MNKALTEKGVNYSVKTLSFLLIFLFSIISVSSAPPVTTVQSFPDGYVIVESHPLILKQNQDFQYNFFVYNTSNGVLLNNASMICNFFLADSSGQVIFSEGVPYFSDGHWGIDILGGNFSSQGEYPYGVSCQGGSGGALAGVFQVTPSGQSGNENTVFFIFIILLLYGITFTGFFGKNIPITILGGMAMIFLGVYLINHGIIIYRDNLTNYIAYLTIGVGAVCSFWAGLEQLEVL